VHRDAGGEDDSGGPEDGEEEEDRPGLREVGAESSPCWAKGAADATVGLGLFSKGGGAEVKSKLYGVDLDEVKVETENRGDEEDDDVPGEGCEERVTSGCVVVDVVGPSALQKDEGAEDEAGDDEGEERDADEAPEVKQALVEERAEASGVFGLIAKEGSGNEKKVDQKIEGNG
jgi:hypothetical protein